MVRVSMYHVCFNLLLHADEPKSSLSRLPVRGILSGPLFPLGFGQVSVLVPSLGDHCELCDFDALNIFLLMRLPQTSRVQPQQKARQLSSPTETWALKIPGRPNPLIRQPARMSC